MVSFLFCMKLTAVFKAKNFKQIMMGEDFA